jgi:cytochrome c-type biogenesis protein CcmH
MSRVLLVAAFLALALVIGALPSSPAIAALTPDELMDDPALEARARVIGKQLRCVVCQNQSIDDSNAELAQDFRRIVRERLEAGDSDAEVLGYMTDRYGEFVLLKPPVTAGTVVLWAGPFAVLLIGAGLVAVTVRRRQAAGAAELTAAERRQLDALLDDEGGRS